MSAVRLTNVETTIIENSTFESNGDHAIHGSAQNFTIKNNKFSGHRKNAVLLSKVTNIVNEGNNFQEAVQPNVLVG